MKELRPWTERLREMVRNGPSPFDSVLTQMSVLVPPGRAYRDTKSRTEWSRHRRGTGSDEPARPQLTDEQRDSLIRQGQRRIAYQVIWTDQRAGFVEVYMEGDRKMLRRGPRLEDE